jgi:hypothetical protein
MTSVDGDRMERELRDLVASVASGEIPPATFNAQLESLHARLLGEDANTVAMVEHRVAAAKAYAKLSSGTDRHHDLEQLRSALGINPR